VNWRKSANRTKQNAFEEKISTSVFRALAQCSAFHVLRSVPASGHGLCQHGLQAEHFCRGGAEREGKAMIESENGGAQSNPELDSVVVCSET
jgi:hypothetical protein